MRLPRLCLLLALLGNVSTPPAGAAPDVAAPLVSDARFAELRAREAQISADERLELALALDERHESARAAELYRLAGASGVGAAELRLGALYEVGLGVAQSYAEARDHYRRAIELGVPEANLRLGLLYLEGWGVPKDPVVALGNIERAAAADYEPAQKILAAMYFTGVRVPKDLTKALVWAERAAKRSPEAQVVAGLARQLAVRTPADLQLAREWYQLSAEQDYTRGMLGMASTFLRPDAKPEEARLGLRWLELAADGGDGAANFYVAGFYALSPLPLEGDRNAQALSRLQSAAAHGELQATEILDLVKNGQPLPMAFQYVLAVPFEERHVQRLAADPRFAEDAHGNRLPRPSKVVWPVYPLALRLAGTEGRVVIDFFIDPTGRPRDARILTSTHPGFGQSALDSIVNSRFEPAKEKGKFVSVHVQQPVIFSLSEVSTPASEAQDRAAGLK